MLALVALPGLQVGARRTDATLVIFSKSVVPRRPGLAPVLTCVMLSASPLEPQVVELGFDLVLPDSRDWISPQFAVLHRRLGNELGFCAVVMDDANQGLLGGVFATHAGYALLLDGATPTEFSEGMEIHLLRSHT
jgi:hypothetical protein